MARLPAVVLLSGGLDSATVLQLALRDQFEPIAVTFDYGQLHAHELSAALQVARAAGVRDHRFLKLDLRAIGGSALTDDRIGVPRGRSEREIGTGIPATYVPARNTIFLSVAAAIAEVASSRDIFIGVNHLDSSGYPDCRPDFLIAFERALGLGTRAGAEGLGLRIRAPLSQLSKGEIIRLGIELGVDYSLTSSCYRPDDDGRACADCDACRLRLAGFAAAGSNDPIQYLEGAGTGPPRATPEPR